MGDVLIVHAVVSIIVLEDIPRPLTVASMTPGLSRIAKGAMFPSSRSELSLDEGAGERCSGRVVMEHGGDGSIHRCRICR